MKRGLLLWLLVAISVLHAYAQSRTIRGKVTDAKDGTALQGVTVTVKGTRVGTVTGPDGSYKLDAPANATLIFTFIGYEQKTTAATGDVVNAQLGTDNKQLSEVVVTALGVTREKKALGYSVGTVKSEELVRAANPNIATAIQGKVSGVEVRASSGMPGASAQILIRGPRFFDSDNTPLYVVDGMPINSKPDFDVASSGVTGTDFAGRSIDIDPNDIESIDVLKGQAASALYGMRAANGVVMITTKSGKSNKAGKPVITVSSNYSFDNISRLPDVQNKYAQGNNNKTFNNFVSQSWGPEISKLADDPKFGGNVPNDFNNQTPTDQTRGKYWNPQKQAWVTPQAYNNPKDFFQTGHTFNTSLNMSQASERGNYAFGFGNTDQKGIIPSTDMKRFNAKFNGTFNLSPKVRVGTSINLSNTNINKLPTGNNSILFQIYGAPSSYDMKGTPAYEAGNPYKQISYRGGTFDNPYWSNQFNSFNEKTRRIFGNAFISYDPIKDLNIRYQLGTDIYTTDMAELYEVGSAVTGAPSTSNTVPSSTAPGGGEIINRAFINRTFNSLLNISYNKQLSTDFKLTALAGSEINDSYTRLMVQDGTGLSAGGFHNLNNASSVISTEQQFKKRTVGFYASAGLDWRKMVYLNIAARNDYASSMPRGKRSFFYPSGSLAWVVSELPSLQGKDIYAKVRVSLAQVGTAGTFVSPVYKKHLTASGGFLSDGIQYPFNSLVGFSPNPSLYDPNFKPQNTRAIEMGAELGFLQNRIGIEYSYTKQNTIDQIFAVPMAGSTGFTQIYRNGGEMSASVHEVSVKLIPVRTRDFEWNLNVNYSKVISKVVNLAEGVDNISLGGFTDPQVRAAIGYSYPSIFGTAYLRNNEGKLVLNDDPNDKARYGMPIQATDNKVIGNVTPDFIMDYNTTLRYKFVRLSVLLQWKKGGQMFSGANRLMDFYGTSKRTENRATDVINYEGVGYSTLKPDGTGGTAFKGEIKGADRIKELYNLMSTISEAGVYGTGYLKLREISLAFDLPSNICQRTRVFKAASLAVSARNILLWSEMPNFDPEASQGNGNMQGGFDYMSLPQTRSIGIGLNLTF
ncbi:MAG TPA: SusC/RagA family TonB-linked outer membrane protein [Chitinophaga sp.]|uniref:SusC/RagA family TonB-linked outer membrane protein n=1 Tax=Chitinophaga sp. TaxID=1869181 RepID=UPI002C1E901D|nr:SusC/RagA family TonB-linked outer membrane protein [Chitinophaga sp.]HVI43568.1 SusC/RagA family TonB-linked outer membrane protein [Chitinophaga sp.]